MSKFTSGFLGNKLVKCRSCGKLTHSNIDSAGVDLCRKCYEEAGMENAHSDGHHDETPDSDCKDCKAAQDGEIINEASNALGEEISSQYE